MLKGSHSYYFKDSILTYMRLVDISGQRFGNLTALRKAQSHSQVTRWAFQCDCGAIVERAAQNVRRGSVKSCSGLNCTYAEVLRCRNTARTASGVRQVWKIYRYRAKKKTIEFFLTQDDILELCVKNCVYCGASPGNVARRGSINGQFWYNGIDRIDSNLGYTRANVETCCWTCNCMKARQTREAFICHIKKILVYPGEHICPTA